jgi:hypothetical protein
MGSISQQQGRVMNIAQDVTAPPHSAEAERGVIGSMMDVHEGAIAMAQARSQIEADYFFVPAHQIIFRALCAMRDEGSCIDLITVTQFLRDSGQLDEVGGAAYVTELSTFVPTGANVQYYIDIVRDEYILRETRCGAEIAIQRTSNGHGESSAVLDELESRIASLRSLHSINGAIPQIQDAAELIARPIIVPDDVIKGMLHRGGKLVLGGASKSYKTWLLIELAISVATGSEWFNGYPTKKGRVLYVNFELPQSFFTKRIRTVCDERQLSIEAGMLSLWNLRGRAGDWPRLQVQIASGKFALIIIDPSYKLLLGKDENKTGDISFLLNEMEILAVRTGAAVAFAAHYSKGNQSQKEAIDRISGSGVWARDPDSILNFTRHEQAACFTVEMTLRNHPPREPFVVRWEYPLFNVDATLDPACLKQAGRKEQYHAKDILALIDKPMSATEIVKVAYEESNIPRRRTFELLADLKVSGLLKQPQNGGNMSQSRVRNAEIKCGSHQQFPHQRKP